MIVAAVCVFAVAWRFHSAWLMARVLTWTSCATPGGRARGRPRLCADQPVDRVWAHLQRSPTGSVGRPVLAAQFGYLPGLLWILIAQRWRRGPRFDHPFLLDRGAENRWARWCARMGPSPASCLVSIIAIMIILLRCWAGRGQGAGRKPWGLFTIAATMPLPC